MPRRFIHSFIAIEGGEWIPVLDKIAIPNAKELRRLKREANNTNNPQILLGNRWMHAFRTPSCVPDTGPFVIWDTYNGWRHRIRVRRTGNVGRIAQEHNWDIRRLKGIQHTLHQFLHKYNIGSVEGLDRFLGDIEEKIITTRKQAIDEERRRHSQAV